MNEKLKLEKYKHSKGVEYKIIDIIKLFRNFEKLVLYKVLFNNLNEKFCFKLLKMFLKVTERNNKTFKKFNYIGE